MPRTQKPETRKTIDEIVEEVGLYPIDAYLFVQQGLAFAVEQLHGQQRDPESSHHVSGRQLCDGLRQFALHRWGLMARAVLRRWNIRNTMDFGRIVFALVDNGYLRKTDEDTLGDFKNVYDFATAFEDGYRIGLPR